MEQTIARIWGIAEPLLYLIGMASASVYFIRKQRAKRRRYASHNGDDFLLGLQVGRPMAQAIINQFGHVDEVIDVKAVIGREKLEDEQDYRKLAREIYRAMVPRQHCSIKLFLSGPVTLNFVIGQLVGLNHFDIQVYQFHPEFGYQAVPMPKREWLTE